MDAVSRAVILKNYIDMIQSLDTLSRDNYMQLFALCVTIHTPFGRGDMFTKGLAVQVCHAAIILGSKTEMDDEVVMLNILMTISGRYFGQGENSNLADRSIRS
jgi:survival of motor neuron protein-interacting protein 1